MVLEITGVSQLGEANYEAQRLRVAEVEFFPHVGGAIEVQATLVVVWNDPISSKVSSFHSVTFSFFLVAGSSVAASLLTSTGSCGSKAKAS